MPREAASQGLSAEMRKLAEAARDASRVLGHASTRAKDDALGAAADAIVRRAKRILAENAKDLEAARKAGESAAFQDRLALDQKRLDGIAKALLAVAALPDPVGEADAERPAERPAVSACAIPLGVIAMMYEARPNVTVEAAALS